MDGAGVGCDMDERDDGAGAMGLAESAVCASVGEFCILEGYCCGDCKGEIGDLEVEYACAAIPWARGEGWRLGGGIGAFGWDEGDGGEDEGPVGG